MADGEILVVQMGEGSADPGRWPVIARAGPAVVVVRADEGDFEEISHHSRLALIRRSDGTIDAIGDGGALDELDEGARLFVRAWRERPGAKPDRPGEGLSWDAPGFEPPGRPRAE